MNVDLICAALTHLQMGQREPCNMKLQNILDTTVFNSNLHERI